MRFAIDACVPVQLAEALRQLGGDVVLAAGKPAMPDSDVLSAAHDRVLITSDKDFGELVFRDGRQALGVVLLRLDLVNQEIVTDIARRIVALQDAGRGVFATLEKSNTRMRALPKG